jgi:hypothetical protein
MTTAGDRRARAVAVASGAIGLVAALALKADLLFTSGVWYPVFYGVAPAVAATAAFLSERPGAGPLRLAGVGTWVLVSFILALAEAVVLATEFPGDALRSPVSTVLAAGLLYAGFLCVPVGLAVAAARRRGLETAFLLARSPLGQGFVAAALVVLR